MKKMLLYQTSIIKNDQITFCSKTFKVYIKLFESFVFLIKMSFIESMYLLLHKKFIIIYGKQLEKLTLSISKKPILFNWIESE